MKKLILLLVILATSCNQEVSSKFSMHKYVGDYEATFEDRDGRVEIVEASVNKINGQYYLTCIDWKSFKLDSTSRKSNIHDSTEYGDVVVAEISFNKNIEMLWYLILEDPTDTMNLGMPQDTLSLSFKKPHQN